RRRGSQSENLIKLALTIAALGHDAGHPGQNNSFFVSRSEPLALVYNDKSVLENYHAYLTFAVMTDRDCNILRGFPVETYQSLRKTIIELILATDMSLHFSALSTAKLRIEMADFDYFNKPEDQLLVCKVCMKAADLGHLTLDWDSHRQWVARLSEEYFRQGDIENLRGQSISPMCDRTKADELPTLQSGFLGFVALPLFLQLDVISNRSSHTREVVRSVEKNADLWKMLPPEKCALDTSLFDKESTKSAADENKSTAAPTGLTITPSDFSPQLMSHSSPGSTYTETSMPPANILLLSPTVAPESP
ncbi:3'5'-cyclic nucleotide phosphodiesterase domain-containing protein, partial [Cardiosporidium cionae]